MNCVATEAKLRFSVRGFDYALFIFGGFVMKKIVSAVLLFAILLFLISCSGQNPLDAVNLKLNDTQRCANCSIKFFSSENMSASYYITPQGFEWDKLEEKDYKMKITVSYDVYYEKDWDLGFGYAGSPKYEVSVVNSDGMGKIDDNMIAPTSSQTKSFSFSSRIADLKNTKLILTLSTDNVQNIIYFKNIKIDYQCYK